jgi:hypothetical protein
MGEKLLEKFAASGFMGLVFDEPIQLSQYLTQAAQADGSAALLVLAEAIQEVHRMALEEDERGGVRVGFLERLDRLTTTSITGILVGDPGQRTKAAIVYRDQVREMLRTYDVRKTYEDD